VQADNVTDSYNPLPLPFHMH